MAGEVDYNKMQEAFERALKSRGGSGGGFSPSSAPSTAGAGITSIASAGLKKGFEAIGKNIAKGIIPKLLEFDGITHKAQK
jgi:hypothetical protein